MAEVGEGSMDFLVPPALCHIPLGKADYEFKIGLNTLFREEILTWDLVPATCDLKGGAVCMPFNLFWSWFFAGSFG